MLTGLNNCAPKPYNSRPYTFMKQKRVLIPIARHLFSKKRGLREHLNKHGTFNTGFLSQDTPCFL